MTVRQIIMYGDPVLRQKSKKIHRFDASIQSLMQDLEDTVRGVPGSGLAAPQIGIPLRAIVTFVDEKLRAVVNPEIVDESEDEIEADEGCLSIPGWYAPVSRKERVTVRGFSAKGTRVKIKAEGWEARAFQHEIDHINGILFIDRLENRSLLHKVESPEEQEELEEEQVFA